MAIQDYFPTRDAELTDWSNNFDAKINIYANTLGITPTEKAGLLNTTQDIRSAITENAQAQATAMQATADKNTRIKAGEKVVRGIIRRAKTSTGYTEAIGKDTGIIGTDDITEWDTYKPTVTASGFPGHVTIAFRKSGAEGVNIYTRIKGTADWTKLAFDSHSPYVDNRASASPGHSENREYMAIGVMNDAEIGQQSDIVSVTFAG